MQEHAQNLLPEIPRYVGGLCLLGAFVLGVLLLIYDKPEEPTKTLDGDDFDDRWII